MLSKPQTARQVPVPVSVSLCLAKPVIYRKFPTYSIECSIGGEVRFEKKGSICSHIYYYSITYFAVTGHCSGDRSYFMSSSMYTRSWTAREIWPYPRKYLRV